MNSNTSSNKESLSGTYRHYKGGLYRFIGLAKHSETLEELAIYKSIDSGMIWVRPKEMFFETITFDGEEVERFEKVEEKC